MYHMTETAAKATTASMDMFMDRGTKLFYLGPEKQYFLITYPNCL